MARAVVATDKKAPIAHERGQETANTRYNPPQPVYNDCAPPQPNATYIFISQPQTDALLQALFSKLKKQIDKGFDKVMGRLQDSEAALDAGQQRANEKLDSLIAFVTTNATDIATLRQQLVDKQAELDAANEAGADAAAVDLTDEIAFAQTMEDKATAAIGGGAPVDPPVDPNA